MLVNPMLQVPAGTDLAQTRDGETPEFGMLLEQIRLEGNTDGMTALPAISKEIAATEKPGDDKEVDDPYAEAMAMLFQMAPEPRIQLTVSEQDEPIDEIERERFWEQYEHYVKCGGNSYIQRKVENLKQAGKL